MPRVFITYEWLTVFSLIGLVAITVAKQLFKLRFQDFIWVFTNSKYLRIYARDQKFVDIFDGLLFSNFVISVSVFLFFSYDTFISEAVFDLVLFLKIILGIFLFFLIKIMIERLIGSVFDIENLMDAYLFQKTTFKNFSGFLFLFFNLFILYSPIDNQWLIYACITLVLISNLIGFINSYQSNLTVVNLNLFYFLLYLCALEIGPYILLFKVLKEYNA
jgi:hypothetical protein